MSRHIGSWPNLAYRTINSRIWYNQQGVYQNVIGLSNFGSCSRYVSGILSLVSITEMLRYLSTVLELDVILIMCLHECAGMRGCNSSVCLNPSALGTQISWGSSLQRLTEYRRWNAKYVVNTHCAVYLQTFIHNHVVIALFYIPRLASYPGYFLFHMS